MLKKLTIIVAMLLFSVSSVYAQDTFLRIGVGGVNFERNPTPPQGEIHFHEAALTANFALGYGGEYFRVMALFDPSIADGVQGTSIVSGGAKAEVGLPWIKWLKLGGGVMYSSNHAKRVIDNVLYERGGLDTVSSSFWSITFLPRAKGPARFFADIRVGKSYGGDVIQPQTSKPVAQNYTSLSLGVQLRFN